MAEQVGADIYGMNYNAWAESKYRSFPTQGVSFYPPNDDTNMLGTNIYGVIKVYLEKDQPEYMTNSTPAQLVTLANTPNA